MLEKILAISKLEMVRSVSMLFAGTALAQAIGVLVLPILTRLYSPHDFSVVAVYTAMLGLVTVAACLRFDIAVPLPLNDRDAANLLALSFASAAGVSIVVSAVVLAFSDEISNTLGHPELRKFLWLLPVGIWVSSSCAAVQFWVTRKKRFSVLTHTRLTQAIGGAGAQIGLGLVGAAPVGLIVGQLINGGAGVIRLMMNAFKNDKAALSGISFQEMRRIFLEYRRFPQYSTLEALANSGGLQLSTLIVASMTIGPAAGYLMLAAGVMQAPVALVGGSVAQVYLSKAAVESSKGSLGELTASVLTGLLKIGVGPVIFLGVLSPKIFPLVFGNSWQAAGNFALLIMPWVVVQLLVSPIAMALHVLGMQRHAMLLHVLGLVVRAGSVYLAGLYFNSWIIEIHALVGAIFYTVYLAVVLNAVGLRLRDFIVVIRSSFPFVASWLTLSLIFWLIL